MDIKKVYWILSTLGVLLATSLALAGNDIPKELQSPSYRITMLEGIGYDKDFGRQDPSNVIKVGDTYHVYTSKFTGNCCYTGVVGHATSTDGIHWKEQSDALTKGPADAWDNYGVLTPYVMAYGGKYYLYYTSSRELSGEPWAIRGPNNGRHIGVAVAESPDGPWKKVAAPVLSPGKKGEWDSYLVDDAHVIVREGRFWLYYKGGDIKVMANTTQWGLAIGDSPTGPFVKVKDNPLIGGHTVCVWPHREGVAALIDNAGPERFTVQWSADGIHFSRAAKIKSVHTGCGPYDPDAFSNTKQGRGIAWGVAQDRQKGKMCIVRFDVDLTVAQQGQGEQQALRAKAAADGFVRWDFETGDLQGWQVMEGAFDWVVCPKAKFRNRPKQDYNKQGKFFLTTLECRNGNGKDGMTGVIESPVFRLDGGQVSFLVGGGAHEDTYVALCTLDGKEVVKARGINDEALQRVQWQLETLVGQKVFLRVVDFNEGGWGHVTFDDFKARGEIDEKASSRRLTERQLLRDQRERERQALLAKVLGGRSLLFVVRGQYKVDHHNTATLFQTGEINTNSFRGGAALKVIDLSDGVKVRTLVETPQGIVRDPEVHFSGEKIVFSMRRDIKDDYHLYEINADGTGLRQLTFGPGVSDIDPLYLPDGSIIFSSTREPKYCMCNRHIMCNLFRMEADGSNIHQIGKSTLFEGHGALMPDGRILYDRWEYVDRNFGDAQGLWTINPDGTNPAVYWGNNTPSPGGVIDPRVIPGTQQIACILGSCHDRPWGTLAIIDRRRGLDGRQGIVRTWPAHGVNRANTTSNSAWDTFMGVHPRYEDPYPLDDRYLLCSRMTGRGEQMGIYLVDTQGEEVLLHTEGPGCYDPMVLVPRARPAVIPTRRDFRNQDGYFYVVDVYEGTHMAGVKRGTVKYLRVVESPEKRFWVIPSWGGQGQEAPGMGWHDFNNKRILGTVPVEEDGSAYFAVPSDRFVYFQLLDENKMMVQSMRSGVHVQSGELTGCVGCHEERRTAPPVVAGKASLALRREASELKGWYGQARLFDYQSEVQPVFDSHCMRCHDYGGKAAAKLNLAGDRDITFNTSYNELWRKGYMSVVGAGPAQIQQAYSWGSHASKLIKTLRAGHNEVKLSVEEMERLTTWIDINAPYYSRYASAYPKNNTGRSPLTYKQVGRLGELTGMPYKQVCNRNLGPEVCFERPELSPCLALIKGKDDAAYREALSIIKAGKAMLENRPRADMPGFVPCATDQRRQEKYVQRQQVEWQNRSAIASGGKFYETKPIMKAEATDGN